MIDLAAQAKQFQDNFQNAVDLHRYNQGMNVLTKMYGPTVGAQDQATKALAYQQATQMNPLLVQQKQMELGIAPTGQPVQVQAQGGVVQPVQAQSTQAAPSPREALAATVTNLGAQIKAGADPATAFDSSVQDLSKITGVPVQQLSGYKAGFVADPLGTVARLQGQLGGAPMQGQYASAQQSAPVPQAGPGIAGGAPVMGAAPVADVVPVMPGADPTIVLGASPDMAKFQNHDGRAKPNQQIPAAPQPVVAPAPAPVTPAAPDVAATVKSTKAPAPADVDALMSARDAVDVLRAPIDTTLAAGGAFDRAMAAIDSLPESPALGGLQSLGGVGPAAQFDKITAPIKSALTLDTIARLKKSGATLGSVTTFEEKMLQDIGGSLSPDTSKDVLRQNLESLRGLFTKIQAASVDASGRITSKIDEATGTKTPKVISPDNLKNPNYEVVPGQTLAQAIAQARQVLTSNPGAADQVRALALQEGIPPELIFGGN